MVPILFIADIEVATISAVPFLINIDVIDAGTPYDVSPTFSPTFDMLSARTILSEIRT